MINGRAPGNVSGAADLWTLKTGRLMSMNRYVLRFFWIFLCAALLTLGCEEAGTSPAADEGGAYGAGSYPGSAAAAEASSEVIAEESEADAAVIAAARRITEGEFEASEEILSGSQYLGDPRLARLLEIVNRYEMIRSRRERHEDKTYAEYYAEYEAIAAKGMPEDPNATGEAVSAVLKVRDYADQSQEASLMSSDFVAALTDLLNEKAKGYEQSGEWVDAYASGYYLLKLLYPKDQEIKAAAERMTDLMILENSLKDNSCETSAERHEGIKPSMFTRSVRALDVHYVGDVDYEQMLNKALEQMRLLGMVLEYSGEDIAYSVEADSVRRWREEIARIDMDRGQENPVVTRDVFVDYFYRVLDLGREIRGLPEEVVIAQYSQAAFGALDPHTTLVWPWEVRDFQKNIMQEFTGIGIEISKITGELKVVSLLPDTPAYVSGLDADDVIVKIDGEEVTEEMSIQCAVSKITGKAGTDVRLTVRRAETGEIRDIEITRARIIVPTIKGWRRLDDGLWDYMIDPENGIGYARITNFTNSTSDDLEEVLDSLEENGMQGFILDLRYNTGGLLSSAADVADKFIERGLIVRSQPKWERGTYERATPEGTHPNYPMVILINGGSASASEIVAGALQDAKYRRATLVGERTFGKGSVQTITPYSGDGSQLKYTMAFYHLPSDQRVESRYLMERQGREDWGIEPDVEVKLKPSEVREMLDIQRANEILAKADHEEAGGKPLERHSREETISADPQLQVAMLVLQSKLVATGVDVSVNVPIEVELADAKEDEVVGVVTE